MNFSFFQIYMKSMNNKEMGIAGEKMALQYLLNKGYILLYQNYRAGRAEIDLVMKRENIIVFVEVKTRNTHFFGNPEASVNFKKMNHLQAVAAYYLASNPAFSRMDIQFDIVSIVLNKLQTEIVHLEDAFW